MDFFTDMAFAVLFALLKNPAAAKKVRPALIKMYRTISAVLATDPEFVAAVSDVKVGGGPK